jgi:hypothetical protein
MKDIQDHFLDITVIRIKIKHILKRSAQTLFGILLIMPHEVHQFSRAIRVWDQPVVHQLSQVSKRVWQLQQKLVRNIRSIFAQQIQLGFRVWVVNRVAREAVSNLTKEIVAQEWKSRPVCQDYHAKARVDTNDTIAVRDIGDPLWRDHSATIRQEHFSILN